MSHRISPRAAARLACALFALLGLVAPARAHDLPLVPKPAREGLRIGLGIGSAIADVDGAGTGGSVSTGWQDAGRLMRASADYFLSSKLRIGGEYFVLRREFPLAEGESDDGSLREGDRYLGSVIVSGALYPNLGGFHVRGGAGFGLGYAQVLRDSGGFDQSEWGAVVVMGAGYEFHYDRSISFSLNVEMLSFAGEPALSADMLSASIGAHLALPRHF